MAAANPKSVRRKSASGFADPAVAAVFDAYPRPLRSKLLALRRLILDTARTTKGVGALQETLKWGQPSYLTPETKSGSTIRMNVWRCVAPSMDADSKRSRGSCEMKL